MWQLTRLAMRRSLDGAFDGALDRGLVEVMAEAPAGRLVDADARSRKHPLPRPLVRRVGVLEGQPARKAGAGKAVGTVGFEELVDVDEMSAQASFGDARERRCPVASALGFADEELLALEVEVLHAEP